MTARSVRRGYTDISHMKLTIRPLTPALWPAREDLFGKSGACNGCWCMYCPRICRRNAGPNFGANRSNARRAVPMWSDEQVSPQFVLKTGTSATAKRSEENRSRWQKVSDLKGRRPDLALISIRKGKGCDIGYVPAICSCEGAHSVDPCTVAALDAIAAFAVPNPDSSSQSQPVFSGLVAPSGRPAEQITQPTSD